MGSHVHDFRSGPRVTGSRALQIGRQKPEREIRKKQVGKHERHKKNKVTFYFSGSSLVFQRAVIRRRGPHCEPKRMHRRLNFPLGQIAVALNPRRT